MDGSQKKGRHFLNLLQKEDGTQKRGGRSLRKVGVPTLEETVLLHTETTNIDAFFINGVSPVKTSGKYKYFDMKLVTKDSARRAVCFAVNRKNEFGEIQNNRSPED